MTRTQTPLQKIRPAARRTAVASALPEPARLVKSMAKQAVHTAAILLSVALLAENALAQQYADDSKWYLESSYSFDTVNLDADGPDDPLQGLEDADFTVAGIGIGYSFTPNWSIEARYRSANTYTYEYVENVPATETTYRGEILWAYELSYAIAESSVVYQFAPDAKTSFHLRGGFQSFSSDVALLAIVTAYDTDNSIQNFFTEYVSVEDGFSDSEAFFGAGATVDLTPQWHIRAEYLVQDGGDLTSYSASAGFRF